MIGRKLLGDDEISAICACYALGDATGRTLVYKGTSSVYRLACVSSRGVRAYAVKVQECDGPVESAKAVEVELLRALPPAFPHVPVLLTPGRPEGPMRARTWGLIWDDRAVSVYEWVDALPYAGTARQRCSAARCFGELQKTLGHLSSRPGLKPAALSSLLDIHSATFIPDFLVSERARCDVDQSSGLSYSALKFLQEQTEIVRAELAQNAAGLYRLGRGLVHAEFTPPNCGFGENGDVRIVFDFEAVRFGPVPLAAAVAIAAFSLTPTGGRNAQRLAEMSAELRSVCPAVSPGPSLLVPLLRLAYVDAAWRQLGKRRANPDRGWGYMKEDVKNLRWLNENAELIMRYQRLPDGGG